MIIRRTHHSKGELLTFIVKLVKGLFRARDARTLAESIETVTDRIVSDDLGRVLICHGEWG